MAARTITTAEGLLEAGLLSPERLQEARAVAQRYAIGVTPLMAGQIRDADDPVGRQFLPQAEELATRPEELADPIGDHAHSPVEGIVHRYPDRVLLKVLHVCPVYCRFCFRREMVGPDGDGTLAGDRLEEALAYIAAHPGIWEVILTGGDPMMLSPRRMADIMERLSAIPHVRVVRLHSRVPVVDPGRVTPALAEALRAFGRSVYVALHANHPQEFTPAATQALRRLSDAGVVLLSQTVLLRGINDDTHVLAHLMRLFVEHRVTPYYIHHPDLAPGTAHFRLPIAEGLGLVSALRGHLSGLCRPTYVLDLPGGHGKVDLESSHVRPVEDGLWELTDFRGRTHLYRDRLA
ncbi:lysine-2,3-aminomutase-like protein [Gellertiella hungarica]|uniref:Lysine 2,3-aminomutase n=1 Tax=Gellertiella hungarica TaxID=1572859 RepID=A0A7W6J9L2_9HYPH|nr:lysine-2,3-aminomutase-like protein [Gellertiella hungarica]MBB4066393.1 lysine 2,3-aminomutase [Gellertiella hungarica]